MFILQKKYRESITFQVTGGFWNLVYINKKYYDNDNLSKHDIDLIPITTLSMLTQCVHRQLRKLTLFTLEKTVPCTTNVHQLQSLSKQIPVNAFLLFHKFESLSQMCMCVCTVCAFGCIIPCILVQQCSIPRCSEETVLKYSPVSPCSLTHSCLRVSVFTH